MPRLSEREDLDAIRERSRTWAQKAPRRHRTPNAGRASRDRQILLRAVDALLADRRLVAPIEIDIIVDRIVDDLHREADATRRARR